MRCACQDVGDVGNPRLLRPRELTPTGTISARRWILMRNVAQLISIVDDDLSALRALGRLVKLAGYSFETFESAPRVSPLISVWPPFWSSIGGYWVTIFPAVIACGLGLSPQLNRH